jgi:hypothetical protein
VTTTVTRLLENTSRHVWTDNEADDTLTASWTDTQVVATGHGNGTPTVERTGHRWDKDGVLGFHPRSDVAGAYDVTGDIAITWSRDDSLTRGEALLSSRSVTSSYDGHATAATSARATLSETVLGRPATSWDHRLRAVNGTFVTDAVG